ncbi:MAG: CheF family chemotaxis protein [Methanolinea sp.]|jgi:hypothetical protein
MAVVPVKIEKDGKWVVSKIDLQQDSMTIAEPVKKAIPFKSIIDLEERKSLLIMTVKGEPPVIYRIASVDKVLQAMKRLIIMACSAYRLMAYFMSPAVRGGVMVTNATWEKGAIAVLKTSIWFVSQNKQISVPLKEVTGMELTKREVQGKQVDVVKIDHMENKDVVTSYVLCPISTLKILINFLTDTTKDLETNAEDLDPLSAQVGMLIYSGMDTHAIENMLNISHKDIDKIYEKLLKIGLIEVVFVRKEVQLTPKGVRFITESVKPPSP